MKILPSIERFPQLVVRGETLELAARRALGPTRVEQRYSSILERWGDAALLTLPFHLVALAREALSTPRPTIRFSPGRVDVSGRSLEVESIRGEAAHGGGGQLVAVCRFGEEVVLRVATDLSIHEARSLAEILDERVRIASIATYR